MDPVRNPYSPGAGSPPPELAGRDVLLEIVRIALARKLVGRPNKSVILVGLRGVGKTVLLNRMGEIAKDHGFRVASIEVAEGRDIRTVLAPVLRSVLFELDRLEGLNEHVKRALRVLTSFVGKVTLAGYGLELGIDPEIGTADSGDLDTDLAQLLIAIGEAAKSRAVALALIVDELQYLSERDFAALIVAMHRISQANLPVILIGAGLPTIRGLAGEAKSYAERLFDFPVVGALSDDAVREAVQTPAKREAAIFSDAALNSIIEITQGYPYFVQEWAYQTWNHARNTRVESEDVESATTDTMARLDEGFFRVRFDRLTNAEKRYLRAMAELGAGPHRSGDVAARYGAKVQSVAPLRAGLVGKGMIYSPSHGDTAFTVPLFDEFIIRTMPNA